MGMRACLALLIVIIAFASPTLAKPSAFEKDYSGKDLQDLEAMLSGEHRGAQYAQNIMLNQQPSQPNPLDELYDPPYKNVFFNDTFFGDFLRELGGGPSRLQANLTWPEILLTGQPYTNVSNIARPAGTSRHYIKPILVKEPDF